MIHSCYKNRSRIPPDEHLHAQTPSSQSRKVYKFVVTEIVSSDLEQPSTAANEACALVESAVEAPNSLESPVSC